MFQKILLAYNGSVHSAAALKQAADLAMLGHTEKGVIARWFQDSLGAQLLDHLPCSLLIVSHK
jgi:nucleotide-binding universal stress UspA family protein